MKTSAIEPAPETAATQLLTVTERQAQQRRGVRRTAISIGLIAVLIYVAFILSGVFGR